MGSKVNDIPLAAEMPPGDVRGFDIRTGKQQWLFHSIPREGEFGNGTWKDGSWRTTGAANVWTMMSADEALGYVYLPFSTPSDDHYGVHRPGDGLFSDSLVCLDARTGNRVWHFQMAHRGLWDYDLPCAPNLIDIQVDGRPVKAVAQVTKQGFCYVFDRITGKPIWLIEERPIPQSTVPGEKASRTQPFPTKPAPFKCAGVGSLHVAEGGPDAETENSGCLGERCPAIGQSGNDGSIEGLAVPNVERCPKIAALLLLFLLFVALLLVDRLVTGILLIDGVGKAELWASSLRSTRTPAGNTKCQAGSTAPYLVRAICG
jgi:hypothetical protein